MCSTSLLNRIMSCISIWHKLFKSESQKAWVGPYPHPMRFQTERLRGWRIRNGRGTDAIWGALNYSRVIDLVVISAFLLPLDSVSYKPRRTALWFRQKQEIRKNSGYFHFFGGMGDYWKLGKSLTLGMSRLCSCLKHLKWPLTTYEFKTFCQNDKS